MAYYYKTNLKRSIMFNNFSKSKQLQHLKIYYYSSYFFLFKLFESLSNNKCLLSMCVCVSGKNNSLKYSLKYSYPLDSHLIPLQ